jgi:hypothetical protein
VLQLVDGDVRGQVVDAVQRLVQRQRVGLGRGEPDQQRAGEPGPAVTATASMSEAAMPASARARCTVGTMASRWAREAISGTTPPKRSCSAMEVARASASSVCPRTMPTPVSSQEVSKPSTSGSLMWCAPSS